MVWPSSSLAALAPKVWADWAAFAASVLGFRATTSFSEGLADLLPPELRDS
jgi:hypothetical protein